MGSHPRSSCTAHEPHEIPSRMFCLFPIQRCNVRRQQQSCTHTHTHACADPPQADQSTKICPIGHTGAGVDPQTPGHLGRHRVGGELGRAVSTRPCSRRVLPRSRRHGALTPAAGAKAFRPEMGRCRQCRTYLRRLMGLRDAIVAIGAWRNSALVLGGASTDRHARAHTSTSASTSITTSLGTSTSGSC